MTRIDAPFLHDPALQSVLSMLETGGHRALIVGGAVRNALIGAPVADLDIATDARPERVVELAEAARLRVVPTGIAHGTVTVVAGGTGFEVTTFRRDVATDGRRAVVAFAETEAEDAQRRDFTINALYADRSGAVLDPTGGLEDLAARRLVFVGDPKSRITEDYLRILRFFRFLAWYGREVEPAALAACAALRGGLAQISAERIGAEMRRLLAAPDPAEALALMAQTGVLAQCLPGASAEAIPALIRAERAAGEAADWPRRLAALGGPHPKSRLRLSRAEAKIQSLIRQSLAEVVGLEAFGNGKSDGPNVAGGKQRMSSRAPAHDDLRNESSDASRAYAASDGGFLSKPCVGAAENGSANPASERNTPDSTPRPAVQNTQERATESVSRRAATNDDSNRNEGLDACLAAASDGSAPRIGASDNNNDATPAAGRDDLGQDRSAILDSVAYHHGAGIARDVALIGISRGYALPPDWQGRIGRAAATKLPLCAADLGHELSGPALGAGLRAAERLWIVSGFTASRDQLYAAAMEQTGKAGH